MIPFNRDHYHIPKVAEDYSNFTSCTTPEVSPTQRTKRKYVRKKPLQPKKTKIKDTQDNCQSHELTNITEGAQNADSQIHNEQNITYQNRHDNASNQYRANEGFGTSTSHTQVSSSNNEPQHNPQIYAVPHHSSPSMPNKNQQFSPEDRQILSNQVSNVLKSPQSGHYTGPNSLGQSSSENAHENSEEKYIRNHLNSVTIILYRILETCLAQINYEPNDLKYSKYLLNRIRDYFICKYGSLSLCFDDTQKSNYKPYENVRAILRQKISRNTSLIRYFLERKDALTDTIAELKNIEGIEIELSFNPVHAECEKTWSQLTLTYRGFSTIIMRIQEDPVRYHRLHSNVKNIFASFEEGECILLRETNMNPVQQQFDENSRALQKRHNRYQSANKYALENNQEGHNYANYQRNGNSATATTDPRSSLPFYPAYSNTSQSNSAANLGPPAPNNQYIDTANRTSVIMRPWDNDPTSPTSGLNFEGYRMQYYQLDTAENITQSSVQKSTFHDETRRENQSNNIIKNENNGLSNNEVQQNISSSAQNRQLSENQSQNSSETARREYENGAESSRNQVDDNRNVRRLSQNHDGSAASDHTKRNENGSSLESSPGGDPQGESTYGSKLLRKIILEIREVGNKGVTSIEDVVSYILLSVVDCMSSSNEEVDQNRIQEDENELLNNPELVRICDKIINKMNNRNYPKEQRVTEVKNIITKILQSQLKHLKKSLAQSEKIAGVVIKQEILDLTQDSDNEDNYDDLPKLIRLDDAIKSGKFTEPVASTASSSTAQIVPSEDSRVTQVKSNGHVSSNSSTVAQESVKSNIKPLRSPTGLYPPKAISNILTVNNQNKTSNAYENPYSNLEKRNYGKAYILRDPFNNTHINKYTKQRGINLKSMRHLLPNGVLYLSKSDNVLYRFQNGEEYKKWLEKPNEMQHYAVGNKLPPDVVFCNHDILTAVEYVREIRLVQHYVPKDFGGFYDYITRSKIQLLSSPVSFCKFLALYNTNQLDEEGIKYINYLTKTSMKM